MTQLASTTPAHQQRETQVETGGETAQHSVVPHAVVLRSEDLSAASFRAYPAEARALAVEHLSLLRGLPLPLLPLLLRELAALDYRFPRERARILAQLAQLETMTPGARNALLAPFRALVLPPSLAEVDWVHDPGSYLDGLTASLWSSGQMPQFRAAAKGFAEALPDPADASSAPQRLALIVLDRSLPGEPGLHKLRARGVSLRVADASGFAVLLGHARARACAAPTPYAHWYVDGAAARLPQNDAAGPCTGLTEVSYDALASVRAALLSRAADAMGAERSGPEELRSLMARTTPEQIGMNHADPVLAHFQLSLLTEGSGTQIFSTTFVQWAARECLRRAEPHTLLLRFTPRQVQRGMNEMLSGAAAATALDPAGSLIDAEQGALYTWLNLQRLSGAAAATCLVWHESTGAAVALGPGLPPGKVSNTTLTMSQALRLLR